MLESGYINGLAAFSVRIWLEQGKICKNNDNICLFHCIYTGKGSWEMFEYSAYRLVFKHLAWDQVSVNA